MYLITEFYDYKKQAETLAGVALIVNKKLCMVLPKKFKGENKYSLPKGKIDFGEEPKKSAHRELVEETGFDILDSHYLPNSFTTTYVKNGIKKEITIFVAKMTKGEFYDEVLKLKRDKKEIYDVSFLKRDKAVKAVEKHMQSIIEYIFYKYVN